jgi:hypothetical protein
VGLDQVRRCGFGPLKPRTYASILSVHVTMHLTSLNTVGRTLDSWVLSQVAMAITGEDTLPLDQASIVILLRRMSKISRKWAMVHALRISVTSAWAMSLLVLAMRDASHAPTHGGLIAVVFGTSGYHSFQTAVLAVSVLATVVIAGATNDRLTHRLYFKFHESATMEEGHEPLRLALQLSTLKSLQQAEGMRFLGVRMTMSRAQGLGTIVTSLVFFASQHHLFG